MDHRRSARSVRILSVVILVLVIVRVFEKNVIVSISNDRCTHKTNQLTLQGSIAGGKAMQLVSSKTWFAGLKLILATPDWFANARVAGNLLNIGPGGTKCTLYSNSIGTNNRTNHHMALRQDPRTLVNIP